MTISVQIKNCDEALSIEVTEVNFDKQQRSSMEGETTRLRPQESRTFYVYHLRDLVIRECAP